MFDASGAVSGESRRENKEIEVLTLQYASQLPNPHRRRKRSKNRALGRDSSQSEVSETSARVFLIPEDIVRNLVIECSVRQMRPTREGLMGNIDRSRVPQSRLATARDVRSVNKTNMPDNERSFPTSTAILDLERVHTNVGLEEAGEIRVVGEGLRMVSN